MLAPEASGHTETCARGVDNLAQVVGETRGTLAFDGMVLDQRAAALWNAPAAADTSPLGVIALPAPVSGSGHGSAINDAGRIAGGHQGAVVRW